MGLLSSLFGSNEDEFDREWAEIEKRRAALNARDADDDLAEWTVIHDADSQLLREAIALRKKHNKHGVERLEATLEGVNRRRAATTGRLLSQAREHVSKGGKLYEDDMTFIRMYGPGGTHNPDGSRK